MPVVPGPGGALHGIEAVIDKDHTSALLARDIGADALLLLTDVAGVYLGFGTDSAVLEREIACDAVAGLGLAPGSMRPKAEAAAEFAASGGIAVIGRMEDGAALLAGGAGTRIVRRPAREAL